MAVDVVIVNWNGGPELVAAARSAVSFGGRAIVVDNASTVGAIEEVLAIEGVTLIRSAENRGFAAGSNTGASAGNNAIVLLLNPDAEIIAGTVADLLRAFETTDAVLIGTGLENGDGNPLRAVFALPKTRDLLVDLLKIGALRRRLRPPRSAPIEPALAGHETRGWVVGSALAVRRADWERLGGLDEGYFLWYEDIDLGARAAQQGGTVAIAEDVIVRHHGASTWRQMPRRRRQWLRLRGTYRYASRHLGRASALAVLVAAPAALAIGTAQDVAAWILRR